MNQELLGAYARLLAQGYDAPKGRIRNPGKFEGEPLYVPMYWDLASDGFANEGAEGSVHFPLDEEDWQVWPQLQGQRDLYLRETDQGFVGEISEEEYASLGMEEGEEIRCDQCEAAMINGVFCHEHGCPNAGSRWSEATGEWVRQRECRECGCTVDEDDPCCQDCGEDEAPF